MPATAYDIKRAAVVGAGYMGAGIAALLASVGIPTLLLDIVPNDARDSHDHAARSRIAQSGVDKALKAKPASAFFMSSAAKLVTVGNIEDDLARLSEADWIIEAVVERLDIKQSVYASIERVRKPDAIISSNTSGLPAQQLLAGRSAEFARHFLITHFFGPVRFMKLLELVATPQTDPDLLPALARFGSERLGKGVVICKDAPNFIGNRIGMFGFASAIHRMLQGGFKIEEIDAITGPAMGHPRSATFRTSDIAGLDTSLHVADNLYENLPHDPQRDLFRMPDFVREMVKRGWLGDKTGQGFYKKSRAADGESQILALDPATLDYRPQDSVRFSSLESVKGNPDPFARLRAVIDGSDRAAQLAWQLTADTLLYSAAVAEEIAYDIPSVDNAMRWGYNWEVGPFQTWDALGVAALAQRMTAEGRALPPLVERVLATPQQRFYVEQPQRASFAFDGSYTPLPATGAITVAQLKQSPGAVVKENRSASLVDMGDGVLLVEFHAKLNAIDDEMVTMLTAAVAEGQRNWRAIVIGNDAPDFCVGANLAQVLMGAKMRMWPMIEKATTNFQQANLTLKYSPVPVIIAPAGRVLGGGAEIVLHGAKVRAAAETYIGLVEVGAGLIPGGGGCKELLARWTGMAREHGPFAPSRHVFEFVAVATVATSAEDARQYGFLRKGDAVTLDRDRLLADAKADALALADAKDRGEWRVPEPPTFRLPGPGGRLVLEQVVDNLRLQGKASEHDAVVAHKLAYVLTGGDCSPLDILTEQQVLDLEREAFVSLCGMPKTQDRMEHLLKTGKPLRN